MFTNARLSIISYARYVSFMIASIELSRRLIGGVVVRYQRGIRSLYSRHLCKNMPILSLTG